MPTFKKIDYYDLRAQVRSLPKLIGRTEECERLTRTLKRRTCNNALLVGPAGIGKTALIYGWVAQMAKRSTLPLIQLDTAHLNVFEGSPELYEEALARLTAGVVVIDDFGRTVFHNAQRVQHFAQLYEPLLKNPQVMVLVTATPEEYAWMQREHTALTSHFQALVLKSQDAREQVRILEGVIPAILADRPLVVPTPYLHTLVAQVERYPVLGQLPRAALHILDEAVALCAEQGKTLVDIESMGRIISEKVGIPQTHLQGQDTSALKDLEPVLNARVVGQRPALKKIATTLQRAKLGLRNPNRPLGSFLMLGPSGVGKTETAKIIAELLFGRPESFIRFDMSEFQQEHTVQRLIGAPSGYVGFEEGGALTNALKREPHSLILLDEIEKAHPKVFDIFLQVLDDGRLTSGQNETIDARNAIIMATSNCGVDEILSASAVGEDLSSVTFLQQRLMPQLAETFRLEFINRFDSVLTFAPLTLENLLEIAQLEVQKVEARLAGHKVQFELTNSEIKAQLETLADPRFGARPVKRFIEETCESLLLESLLA